MTETMKEYRCPSCGAPKPRAGTCRCLYCETVSDCHGRSLTETEAAMREYYDTTLLSNVAHLQSYDYSYIKNMARRTEDIGRMLFV